MNFTLRSDSNSNFEVRRHSYADPVSASPSYSRSRRASIAMPAAVRAGVEQRRAGRRARLDAPKGTAPAAPRRDMRAASGTRAAPASRAPVTEACRGRTGASKKAAGFEPGNGPRAVYEADINDPLSTVCDPAGFPRLVIFETRPVPGRAARRTRC